MVVKYLNAKIPKAQPWIHFKVEPWGILSTRLREGAL